MILLLAGLALGDELADFDEAQRKAKSAQVVAEPVEEVPEDPRQQLIRDWAPKVQIPVQEAWMRELKGASVPAGDYAAYLRLICGEEREILLYRSSGHAVLDEALVKAAAETAWPDPPAEILEAFGGSFTIDLGFTLNAGVPPEGKLHLP